MTLFTEQVLEIIQSIPSGKVMTYGQIAGLAGNPSAARQVVRILHSMSGQKNLPWHRIVNAKGKIAFQNTIACLEQKMLLEIEGVEVDQKLGIDLARFQWKPKDEF